MKSLPPLLLAVRSNVLRCLGLLAAAATIALSMQRLVSEAVDRQVREAERRAMLTADMEAARGDAPQAELGLARVREMTARGMIGPEHRADWLRRMSEIEEARHLPKVEFELAPQQSAAIATVPQRAGRYEFLASAMRLRLGLLHEQDLLDFFDQLDKSVSAIPRIRSCHVERAAEADSATAARLSADCNVDWITVRENP